MFDINHVLDNLELYKADLQKRKSQVDLEEVVELNQKRKDLSQQIEKIRHERNSLTAQLHSKPSDEVIRKGKTLKDSLADLEPKLEGVETLLDEQVNKIPNLVSPHSPLGPEENKKVLKKVGNPTKFAFEPSDHEELASRLDLIDFERGAKVSGSKFYYLKRELVLLEFALVNYLLEILTKEGFIPIITPEIIKDSVLKGMGFMPRGKETQIYSIEGEDLSLIGTAEHTLGGMHADETLDASELPLKYVGFSSCFRTEAGGYGKFSKGLYRVHQFDKVEMFIYTTPDKSEQMHDYLLGIEEDIWTSLGIPYQVVDLPTEDLGAPSYRTYDIEAWMPGREGGQYGEVCSTSNTTDYQARRLNIKYKDGEKTEFAHLLNGTAIAMSRAFIAILENYQQEDGSITIPQVLGKYTTLERIGPR